MSEKEKEKDLELENEGLVEKPKVELDSILVEEVGEFGRFQLKLMLLVVPMALCLAPTYSEYIFTTARIRSRCWIPECENVTEHSQFSATWLENAIPLSNTEAGLDQCQRFAPLNSTSTNTDGLCSPDLFDRNTTMPCEAYVYENANTVVYEFGLACDEWRRTMIGTAKTIGSLVAMPLTGFVSDRWGRRTALFMNFFCAGWIGLARYWANSYTVFVLSEFFESLLGSGSYSCIYILLMETVGPKYRVICGSAFSSLFSIGHILSSGLAWAIPYWRTYTLTLYTCQLLVLCTFRLLPESIRWYMSKGHFEKCETNLKKIAKANGKKVSEKSLIALRETAKESRKEVQDKKDNDVEDAWLIVKVCRYKPMLFRCLVSPIWWMSLSLIYYGLTINSVNLAIGNKYLNYLLISLAEIVGYWTACALINRLGRKPVIAASYWICALSQIGYIVTANGSPKILLALYLVGKWSIAIVVTSLYLYTSELFPSQYRHSLVGFCSMIGRFGSILAPLTPAFGGNIPFALFAGLGALSGSLVLLTPETLGCRLPDTMEEAADIGRRKNKT